MEREKVKIIHALKLLSNLEKMRKTVSACDLLIMTSNKSFDVHRAILMAASEYFKKQLAGNSPSSRYGCLQLSDITEEGLERCLEFIYTGKVDVNFANVEGLLQAGHKIKLWGVIEICLQYLKGNTTAKTGILSLKLFYKYGKAEDRQFGDNCLTQYLEELIDLKMLSSINESDFTAIIEGSGAACGILWRLVINWIGQSGIAHSDALSILVHHVLNKKDVSESFIIRNMWSHPLVRNCKHTQDVVREKLLAVDRGSLEKEVDLELALQLRSSQNAQYEEHFSIILHNHVAANFEKLVKKREMKRLLEDDLVSILSSKQLCCHDETLKWDAVLNWTKHDQSRQDFTSAIMYLIDFHKMPKDYLETNLQRETLVQRRHSLWSKFYNAIHLTEPNRITPPKKTPSDVSTDPQRECVLENVTDQEPAKADRTDASPAQTSTAYTRI